MGLGEHSEVTETESEESMSIIYNQQQILDFMKSPAGKLLSQNNSFVIDSEDGGAGDCEQAPGNRFELFINRDIDDVEEGDQTRSPMEKKRLNSSYNRYNT